MLIPLLAAARMRKCAVHSTQVRDESSPTCYSKALGRLGVGRAMIHMWPQTILRDAQGGQYEAFLE